MSDSHNRGATILVIEDVDWIRSGMRKSLELYGYRILEAGDARQAVEIAEIDPPELILTEEQLPTLDILTERLRSSPTLGDLPVAIINPDWEANTLWHGVVVLADYGQIEQLLVAERKRRQR
jgi:CheY-like chemotaxis protein